MDLFPSVPRAALPRPGHPLHERPAAKSTSARGATGGRAAFTWLKPLAAALGGEASGGAWNAWIASAAKRREAATRPC